MDPIILNTPIETSSCCDFFKPLNLILDEIGIKIKNFSAWFFSLFECFFRSEEPTIVRIVSYNAGTIRDYEDVIKLRNLCGGNLPENSLDIENTFAEASKEEPFVKLEINEFKANQERIKLERAALLNNHKADIRKTIGKIVEKGAEILCLQEVHDDKFKENDSILPSHFSNRNYGNNCAVAWDTTKYTLIGDFATYKDDRGRDCVYVNLKNNQTNKIIRVASYHLVGYDLKKAQIAHQNDEQFGEITRPIKCLTGTLEALKNCDWLTPDAVILGMDSNATPETSPKHFETFETHGFIRDHKDTKPTNINADLCEPVKLDYLLASPLNGGTVEIESYVPITKKNGNEWTLWNKKNPSDHLPIGATVTIK